MNRRTLVRSLAAAGIALPLRVHAQAERAPSTFAVNLINRISSAAGVAPTFTVFASNVETAEARLVGGIRQIVYNEDWLRRAEIDAASSVPALVVLAHEVGHHLNGHTLNMVPSDAVMPGGLRFRVREELESDEFAGRITARLDYPFTAGLPAFAKTGETRTVDYPSRTERQEQFQRGWETVPRSAAASPALAALAPPIGTEVINVYTHSDTAERVQSQFRGRQGRWLEYQNEQEFARFTETSRDSCDRILIYDEERNTWVRLTPNRFGFGLGEFNSDEDASPDTEPETWHSLDPENTIQAEECLF